MKKLDLVALDNIPLISPGDKLADVIFQSINSSEVVINEGDILVVAQKIVSKAENRYVSLNDIIPSNEANLLAKKTDKDPRLVELILQQSKEVVRFRKGVIVVENKLGFVHANAGIDRSNISSKADDPKVLLLPENPDQSAEVIRKDLSLLLNKSISIIINDSAGRAWRNGIVGIAIGSSGFSALTDLRGQKDLYGKVLEVTEVGLADELASAASILMGQGDEGLPVVVIKGLKLVEDNEGSQILIRPIEDDLFR